MDIFSFLIITHDIFTTGYFKKPFVKKAFMQAAIIKLRLHKWMPFFQADLLTIRL
jgi:hypothetical protein